MASVAALVQVIEPVIGAKKIAKCSNIEVPSNNLYTTHLQEVRNVFTELPFIARAVLCYVFYRSALL